MRDFVFTLELDTPIFKTNLTVNFIYIYLIYIKYIRYTKFIINLVVNFISYLFDI